MTAKVRFLVLPLMDIKEKRRRNVLSNAKTRNTRKELLVKMRGGCCELCGYCKCLDALEFHHIDPSIKKFQLSKKNIGRRWEEVLEELAKCILVCANCHREIEYNGSANQKLAMVLDLKPSEV